MGFRIWGLVFRVYPVHGSLRCNGAQHEPHGQDWGPHHELPGPVRERRMSSRPAHTVVAGEGGGECCGRRPSGDGARSCMKRELHQKLSGDEVHHTSSFISLVNNTLFSILHCQKALDSILCSCNTPPSEEPPSGGGVLRAQGGAGVRLHAIFGYGRGGDPMMPCARR